MKNLAFVVLALTLMACGAHTPFQRGNILGAPSDSGVGGQSSPVGLNAEFFAAKLQPLFEADCAGCHGNPASDFEAASGISVAGAPENSPLYRKASGGDGHPFEWSADSEALNVLKDWILGATL